MDRKKNATSPYPAEFRERAVQMVIDHLDGYRSLTAAVRDIAGKLIPGEAETPHTNNAPWLSDLRCSFF